MIEINGKYYIIDMDKLMSWVSETPISERNINTTTTMTFPITNDGDEDIIEKEISETKSTMNDAMNSIRYDFVRILINSLFTTLVSDVNQILTYSLNDLTFAQKIAFNTLLDRNIIKEINKIDNE